VGTVYVVDKNGRLATVPKENLEQALANGFRLESPEESSQRAQQEKYGGDPLRAGAQGVLRGATLGLSDPILEGLGVASPEELKGRKEANPNAALAGEVGGTLASSVLPGGPGKIVGRLGEAVEGAIAKEGAGLGTKLLAKGAAGAVEGGVYGAGQAESDAALEGEDLKAEKLVAGIGFGALLGGTGNAVLGAAGTGAKKVLSAATDGLTDGSMKSAIENFARNRTLKASGFIQKDLSKLSQVEQRETAKVIQELDLVKAGDRVEDFLPKAQAAKEAAGAKIGAFYEGLDNATNGGAFKYDRLLQRIDDELAQKANPIERQYLAGVMDKELAAFKGEAEKGYGSFQLAHQMRSTLDNTINYGSEKVNVGLKKRLRGIFDDELKQQAEAVAGKDALNELKAANRQYSALAKAVDAAESGTNRSLGNRQVSLTDYLTGIGGAAAGVATGNVAPMLMAGGGALANKLFRERGSSFLAVGARRLAESGIDGVLSKFNQRLESGMLGAAGDAVQAGVRGAQAPAVSGLMELALGPDREQDPKDRREALAMHVDELSHLVTNPEAMTQRLQQVSEQLGDASPQMKTSVGATVARAINFLHGVAPKAPEAGGLPALQRPWRPTDAEVQKFERYVRAVSDPLSVLETVKQGRVTREAVEAMQAVYPQLADQVRTGILERLADKKHPLPYTQRVALQSLLGNQQGPQDVALLQTVHQPSDNGPSQQPPSGARLNTTRGLLTESERLASR
jgi:hypothetical protein